MAKRAPAGLGAAGKKFWREILDVYELSGPELRILAEVCHTLDTIDELEASVRDEGRMISGSKGQPRLHPAITELRQQRLALGRLLGQLQFPHDDAVASPTQVRAERAARARWDGRRLHAVEG